MTTTLTAQRMFSGAKALPFAGLSSAAGWLLTALALQAATPPDPAVEMRFPEGTNGWGGAGVITTNTGTLGGVATFYQPVDPIWETNLFPIFTTNVPVGTYVPASNEYSVDIGPAAGSAASGTFGRAIDLVTDFPGFEDPPGYNPGSVGSLPKLTVCGWLNARQLANYADGNRIAYAMEGTGASFQGFELVHGQLGELGLSINNMGNLGKRSSPQVPADPNVGTNNWVFFAVTYDPTLPADHVKYYFGRPNQLAYLDAAYSYTPTNIDYTGTLTIGNFSEGHPDRNLMGSACRYFKGLIDELRIYTNALTLDEVQQAQLNAPVPPTAASFLKQPVDVTSVAGGNATFSCEASGSGVVTFQWRTNGVAVPGATKSTWTWSNVQQANNGTIVSVLIDNDVTVDPGVASSDVTLTVLPAEPKIVSMSFSANNDILTANSGAFAGAGRRKLVGGFPIIIDTNVPSGSKTPHAAYNIDSLHMGPTAAHRAVDMTNNIISPVGNLGNMSALTICGWLNSANDTFRTTSTGRGCGIVNASLGGANGGFVLGYRSDNLGLPYGQNGRLQFHVNEWNTDGTTANLSSPGTIPIGDTNCAPENWVFFAVTYDGTSSADNLSFYFGNKDQEATNDVTSTYNKGVIAKTGPLAIGNHNCTPGNPNTAMPGNPTGRSVGGNNGAMWRGLIDEIKIFSKVLTLEEIRAEQYAPSLPPYLKYATETNNLVLSWEGPFQLQDRASLDMGSWADNTTPTNISGTIRSLGVPLSGDSKFFRLRE